MWAPPGRTFSPASIRAGFRPEQIDHYEVAAEQPFAEDVVLGVRVFRQQINDQLVTLFGLSIPARRRQVLVTTSLAIPATWTRAGGASA
jgi:hypothetical protein